MNEHQTEAVKAKGCALIIIMAMMLPFIYYMTKLFVTGG